MILADKIAKLRKKNGWSQEELAEKMNVSRQAVSKWESAQTIPDLGKILQLGNLFGVTTDYLLKDEIEDAEKRAEKRGEIRGERRGERRGEKNGGIRKESIIVKNMYNNGITPEEISTMTNINLVRVKNIVYGKSFE